MIMVYYTNTWAMCTGQFVHAAATARRLLLLHRRGNRGDGDGDGYGGGGGGGVGGGGGGGGGQLNINAHFVLLGGGGLLPALEKLNGLYTSGGPLPSEPLIEMIGEVSGPAAMMAAMSQHADVIVNPR